MHQVTANHIASHTILMPSCFHAIVETALSIPTGLRRCDRGTPLSNQSGPSPRVLPLALMALAILSLGGCLQTAFDAAPSKDPPNAYDAVRSTDLQPRFPEATRNANTGGAEPKGVSYYGAPVEALVATAPDTSEHDGAGGFALNFENTPVATVAKVVLGDILNV